MARIPTIISDPARNVMPASGSPAYASPDAFGAGIGDAALRGAYQVGEAAARLGNSVIGLGVAMGDLGQAQQKKEQESAVANGVANFDFTGDYLEIQKNPNANGLSYAQNVANAYDEKVAKYIDPIQDNEVRARVKMQLMSQKPQYVNSANDFTNRQQVALDRSAADSGLSLQSNRVRADGSIDTYNDALAKSNAVIDARPNLTPVEKEIMKKKNAETLALRRFEGLVSAAGVDPDQLAGLENELTAPNSPWKSVMSGEAYDRTLDKIVTLKRSANSQESSAARAALQTVTQRNDQGELIDPAEMSAVQDTVMKSKNPALLSQFAMIGRAQQIYRDHRGLPLDQQRAKIEELRKRGGITSLPAPVQDGINQGAQLTGGAISTEFLAGLVGVEYGKYLNTGDYGRGTDNGMSDAVGVAQFTTGTWLSTLRAHASELGIDAGKSDAELNAMRSDPVLSIKAAALHAADNKRILEGKLGRPMNDADLYFAHLLGTAGAERFLSGATQDPNAPATKYVAADQVAANRSIFFDEAGRARTAAQVRAFIANATMNNLSRVDYAGVKAATLVYNNTVKGLKDDPITFAATLGRFGDAGSVTSVEGLQRRGVFAQQVAEYFSIPSADVKPFTRDEAEALAKIARDGTADETLQVMSQIQALGSPDIIRAANRQIGEKDALFGYAASLAYNRPASYGVAADVIRGEKRIKEDKDVLAALGATETEIQAQFSSIVGKALAGTKLGTETRKAAVAHYVERQLSRGAAKVGSFDKSLFDESIQAVLGAEPGKAAVASVNGAPTFLPQGVDRDTFARALNYMTPEDYVAASKWGGPPRYADGSVVTPREIAVNGKFEAIGGGEYRIKMGDGKYALTGAYKDGSADFYVFRANPDTIRTRAQQVRVEPNVPSEFPVVTP